MQGRWLVGILVVLVLLGSAVSLAQRASTKTVLAISLPQDPQPKRWRSAGDPQMKVAEDPPSLPPPGRMTEPEDPVGAVDSFLQRSQKEADDSIKALTQEAETLRARLQKVETALSRWQGVAQALDQQAKTDGKTSVPLPEKSQTSPIFSEPSAATPPLPATSPPVLPTQREPATALQEDRPSSGVFHVPDRPGRRITG